MLRDNVREYPEQELDGNVLAADVGRVASVVEMIDVVAVSPIEVVLKRADEVRGKLPCFLVSKSLDDAIPVCGAGLSIARVPFIKKHYC